MNAHRQTPQGVLLAALADASYDALMVLDDKCRVLALNSSAEELFECKQPIGQSLLDVTGSPELESVVSDTLEYEEDTLEDQITIGKRVYRVRAQVIRHDGVMLIGLALQDVSELVRLNRARREMIANISHELRHPIANIRLIIDSLFHEDENRNANAAFRIYKPSPAKPIPCCGSCRKCSTCP